jgi:hypothetical protein
MSKYDDYYYYELTNDDKYKSRQYCKEGDKKLIIDHMFIKNGFTFNDIFKGGHWQKIPIILFGKCEKSPNKCRQYYILKSVNGFSYDYGQLFGIYKSFSEFTKNCSWELYDIDINENDTQTLYSKIPSYVSGKKCISLIFLLRELCKNDLPLEVALSGLPEDVIKYMVQFIIKITYI